VPVLLIVGAIIGAGLTLDVFGGLAGAAIGYLLGELARLKRRIAALEAAAAPAPGQPQVPAQPARQGAETAALPATPPGKESDEEAPAPQAPAPAAPAPVAPPPPKPARTNWLFRWLTGGNTVVRLGVVVLFFGVAFLLKYAAEHTSVPVELRLAGVALGAIGLLVAGIRLRRRREGYGLTLEGGAVGILYLVVFAALRLYGLLPAPFAFALLVAICALSAVLAVMQNSLALAVIGVAGGFLAPILTSTGGGDHVQLFSYYAILNAGILAIGWFRSWRLLNLVGFAFTFVIGGLWGYEFYTPEFFASTEPFLVLFFVMYVAIAVLFALRRPPTLRDPVDAGLLFGVPVVGFALQSALVRSFEYGMAWSALAIGAFYLGLAALLLRRGALRQLVEVFIALAVIFATLAIPLALDGRWTAAAWAIEGAGILWVGLRQDKRAARLFGLALQLGAGLFFIDAWPVAGEVAVFNSAYFGALMLAGAGLVSGILLHRYRAAALTGARTDPVIPLVWSALWWYFGAFNEIDRHVDLAHAGFAGLLVIAGSILLAEWLGTREQWRALRYGAAINLLFLPLALAWSVLFQDHPFAHDGFIAWPAVLAANYFVLRRHEIADLAAHMARRHVIGFWVILAIVVLEVRWLVGEWLPASDWAAGGVGVLLAAIILAVHRLRDRAWPLRSCPAAYLGPGLAPAVLLAIAWVIFVGIDRPGNSAPIAYVPLLNPVDVSAMFVMAALYYWSRAVLPLLRLRAVPVNILIGALAFGFANAVLFRSLHHFAGLPYSLDGMLPSVLAQTAISIFWTSIALVLMLLAVRTRSRVTWVVGGALLGAVVVKLVLVDLSNSGTVARIVSFVVVGLLLLVIGYLAPVPPRAVAKSEVSE